MGDWIGIFLIGYGGYVGGIIIAGLIINKILDRIEHRQNKRKPIIKVYNRRVKK